uniref:FHA domain-containing protein n=1 Tax=Kalanchoe fedtschenkoi TaxID=63787 RepID=A0A7N0SZ17_KALFE
MALEERSPKTVAVPKSDPSLNQEDKTSSRAGSTYRSPRPDAQPMSASLQEKRPSPEEFILSVASNIAAQPLQNFEPEVWGVLAAISANARKRRQGINIILTADEHRIGRLVPDKRFQIESASVSANHCKIYRKKVSRGDSDHQSGCYVSVLLKDTSTNGTYLNWEKLTKNGPEAELRHGDIISFASPPQNENTLAFVFRDVLKSDRGSDGAAKRKAEELGHESKRLKGIGIGAPDGPLSLDDFRSLQRSNTELRKQLENHVATIDLLRNESRSLIEHHEHRINEMKESIEKSYSNQLQELHQLIELKQKELDASNKTFFEQKHMIDDLNERLTAYIQSTGEAKEIMASQKASISEMKAQLDDERDQRRKEREKAASDLKAAVIKAQSEAEDELNRISESSCKRDQEQQEVINKLQESEKERCLLVDTLRTKLDDTRQKLIISENKVRQLEAQLSEENLTSSNGRKRVKELEDELRGLKKKLESEKAAREEAWAKVSVLELEISAAVRDLEYERRRLRGARERIILRETQLRAFYSTTEEISSLFTKQQEQLKAMQKTLEDEENYDNDFAEIDLNANPDDAVRNSICGNKQIRSKSRSTDKAGSSTSANRYSNIQVDNSSDDACGTEKHDCDIRTGEEAKNTQEMDSATLVQDGICGDINDIGTEQVQETESPGGDEEDNHDGVLAGETMQVDETQAKEIEELAQMAGKGSPNTIRTQDLLASEAAGSWACSTAPSAHGENDSPRTRNDNNAEVVGFLHDSNTIVAESQCSPSPEVVKRRKDERLELSEMIGIVAPELKEHFSRANTSRPSNHKGIMGSISDSDTGGIGSDDEDEDSRSRVKAYGGAISDAETDGGDDDANEYSKSGDSMDEDEEAIEHDSDR